MNDDDWTLIAGNFTKTLQGLMESNAALQARVNELEEDNRMMHDSIAQLLTDVELIKQYHRNTEGRATGTIQFDVTQE